MSAASRTSRKPATSGGSAKAKVAVAIRTALSTGPTVSSALRTSRLKAIRAPKFQLPRPSSQGVIRSTSFARPATVRSHVSLAIGGAITIDYARRSIALSCFLAVRPPHRIERAASCRGLAALPWIVLEPGQSRAPTSAGSRRATLPGGRHRGHGTGVHGGRSAVKGGDGRGPEAFDDQINAQRKFPNRDRECDHTDRAMLRRETEDHGAVASDQQGRSDESEYGKNPRHQARLVQQRAYQQRIDGRNEALAEQEDPVIHADQRMAGDLGIRSGSGLLQGHERQDARHAGEDGAAFQGSRADEAQSDSLILPLD